MIAQRCRRFTAMLMLGAEGAMCGFDFGCLRFAQTREARRRLPIRPFDALKTRDEIPPAPTTVASASTACRMSAGVRLMPRECHLMWPTCLSPSRYGVISLMISATTDADFGISLALFRPFARVARRPITRPPSAKYFFATRITFLNLTRMHLADSPVAAHGRLA